eukprot:676933-Amphidinium_carterae.1
MSPEWCVTVPPCFFLFVTCGLTVRMWNAYLGAGIILTTFVASMLFSPHSRTLVAYYQLSFHIVDLERALTALEFSLPVQLA